MPITGCYTWRPFHHFSNMMHLFSSFQMLFFTLTRNPSTRYINHIFLCNSSFFCLIHNTRNNMNASHAQQPFHPLLTVNPHAFHSSSLNRRLYERVYNNNDPQMRGLYIGCCFDVYFGLFNLLGDERVWKVFTAEHYDFPYFSISIKNRLKYLSLLCWWCS